MSIALSVIFLFSLVKIMAKKKSNSTISSGLKDALSDIEKEFGVGAVMKLGSKGHVECPSIPTGALTLDVALGIGGFPRGRIVEIYGPESSGKTTVCSHVVASAQKAGGMCAFIDTEHALDPQYLTRIGVDIKNLLISQPDCGEDALNIAEKLIRSNELAVVVIDSVAALTPRAELEGQMGDSHVGLQARLMSQALRKLTGAVCSSNTCLIFTNQIRHKIGVMFGSPETTAGGNALKFYASIRLDIRRIETVKNAAGVPISNRTRVKVVKNKVAPPFRQAEFDIVFPNGISTIGCIVDMAVIDGIIEKRGSWFSFGSDQLGQGRDATMQTLLEDNELCNKVEDMIKAKHGLGEPVEIKPDVSEDSSNADEKTAE